MIDVGIHEHFLDFGWDTIAAVATLGLAAATYVLARRTRDMANYTRQDIEAQWHPVLMPLTTDVWTDGVSKWRLKLTVVNGGKGPALNVKPSMLDVDTKTRSVAREFVTAIQAQAPGEFTFELALRPQVLVVTFEYDDIRGEPFWTRLSLSTKPVFGSGEQHSPTDWRWGPVQTSHGTGRLDAPLSV